MVNFQTEFRLVSFSTQRNGFLAFSISQSFFLLELAGNTRFLNNTMSSEIKDEERPKRPPIIKTTTATATATPQNNRFNDQKQSLCTCVLHFGTFLCRPLQNNNVK